MLIPHLLMMKRTLRRKLYSFESKMTVSELSVLVCYDSDSDILSLYTLIHVLHCIIIIIIIMINLNACLIKKLGDLQSRLFKQKVFILGRDNVASVVILHDFEVGNHGNNSLNALNMKYIHVISQFACVDC